MNSLTELNGYVSNLTLPYEDNRAPDVTFNIAEPVNQTQTVDEGFTFQSSVGIEITEITGSNLSNPTYTIDVSSLVGASVSWATLPAGVTLTTPATRVYRLSGITSKEIWDAVKTATITLPANYNGVWTYTSTIAYYSQSTGNSSKAWTTTVLVNDVVFLTTPLDFSYAANETVSVAGTPQIINVDTAYPSAVWTVTATPSNTTGIDTWTTTGAGGTFSVNSTTKVITISGTRAQVNSRLSGLSLDASSLDSDFILTYAVSNNLNGNTDTAIQYFKNYGLTKLNNPTAFYFIEDATSVDVEGTPLITDTGYDGTGAYSLTIVPSTTSAVKSLIGTPQAKAMTVGGNTKITTTQKKIGTGSISFDGASSSYITVAPIAADIPSFNFKNRNFTIEFWIRIPAQTASGGIISTASGQNLGWNVVLNNGYVEFQYGVNPPTSTSPYVGVYRGGITSRLIANTWTNICFECFNGVVSTYRDGVLEQETTINTIADGANTILIGKGSYFNDGLSSDPGYWRSTWTTNGSSVNGLLTAFVDEIRISNVARYNDNFVPAVDQFNWDKSTLLLVHGDGENNSTSIADDVNTLGVIGSYSYNNSTKTLTFTGTRDQINGRLDFFKFIPETDWGQDFAFTYTVTTPRDQTGTKQQVVYCGSNDTEIANMNISRAYTANRMNQIFLTDTPFINDLDVSEGLTYTFSITSALGKFAFGTADAPVSFLSFSGTKEQCNAKFSSIRFYPTSGVSANGTFTYTQIKNGVTHVNQNVALTGTYAPYYNARNFLISTSQTYTPTIEDVEYGSWELALVGGGGNGSSNDYAPGGGGGGEVLQIQNAPITRQTYSLTVGAANEDTVAFGYTARKGLNGLNLQSVNPSATSASARTGGNSGNELLGGIGRRIGTVGDLDNAAGGGGAGSGEAGEDVSTSAGVRSLALRERDFALEGSGGNGLNGQIGQTYSNITTVNTTGTGSGLRVTVTFSNNWLGGVPYYPYPNNITITINDNGLGYNLSDKLRILGTSIGGSTPANDMYISVTGQSYNPGRGGKGVYIAWTASANSMYGWYGGGGGGGWTNRTNAALSQSGSIGNLITFAANGGTQTNGLTTSFGSGGGNVIDGTSSLNVPNTIAVIQPKSAPAGSGGGGGGGGYQTTVPGLGGSGIIGVRITSKG